MHIDMEIPSECEVELFKVSGLNTFSSLSICIFFWYVARIMPILLNLQINVDD